MSDNVHTTSTVPNIWSPAYDYESWTVPTSKLEKLDYKFIPNPMYTWKVVIGSSEAHGLSIHYTNEQLPCWFHRKMQEFVLGFKWFKL